MALEEELELCFSDWTIDRLVFMGYTKIWRGAIKYEHWYLHDAAAPYFVDCHNMNIYLTPVAERNQLYAEVSSW